MYRCASVTHMWLSEDNFLKSVLSFHPACQGLNSGCQTCWQALLSIRPSWQSLTVLFFLDHCLFLCFEAGSFFLKTFNFLLLLCIICVWGAHVCHFSCGGERTVSGGWFSPEFQETETRPSSLLSYFTHLVFCKC